MNHLLHILTTQEDALAETIINHHRELLDQDVRVFDLRQPEPDYSALLEQIFAADSIQVW